MIKDSLKLPRISCSEREQENMTDILDELHHAKAVVTFYQNQLGEDKFLFTNLGETEFLMLLMIIHRHIQVFEFFKLLVISIEKFREDWKKGHEFLVRTVEYIKLKNKKTGV